MQLSSTVVGLLLHLQLFGFVIWTFELVCFLQCSAMLFGDIYICHPEIYPVIVVWTVCILHVIHATRWHLI